MKSDPPGVRVFGHLADGTPVHAITLQAPSGLCAQVLTYGGILRRLQVPTCGSLVDVVLGLPDLGAYLNDRHHLGTVVGRFGNRIKHARFVLDGREYQLDRNDGAHHLHGGAQGFGRRIWTLDECSPAHAVLGYQSPAGEQGYPGCLTVSARFELHDDGLELSCRARTDATTIINLTHHPYFNLSGNPSLSAAAHWLRIPADHYLPVDDELIPLGEIAPVQGTPFDFRTARRLSDIPCSGHPQLQRAGGYDHCLILESGHPYSAELYSPHSGIIMRLVSPMPGVQLYGGQGLAPRISGLCLEPQHFPDSPNQPHFPSTILHLGEDYTHRIHYQFAAVAASSDWEGAVASLRSSAGPALAYVPGHS